MVIRIGEIDAASTVTLAYLTGSAAHRVSPMRNALLPYARKDRVEIVFADQKRVVLRLDRSGRTGDQTMVWDTPFVPIDGLFSSRLATPPVPEGSYINRSIPIVAETEQIPIRVNFPLNSRAEISDE